MFKYNFIVTSAVI